VIRLFLIRLIKARWLQHLGFWCASWYLLLRIFSSPGRILPIDLIYTSMFLVPVAACVYLNLLFLIPRLLGRKKYFLYVLALAGSLALFSWLNMLLFSRFIDWILPGYYFISYYDYDDLLKFFGAFTLIAALLKLSRGWFLLTEARTRMAQLEKEHATAELGSLRNQIHPHFLFNSLNMLYSLVVNRSEAAPEAILRLSGFLRYLLYETSSDRVDLEQELAMMQDYLELQRTRSGELAVITSQITGDPKGKKIAPLLFLPLLENSFKHGIKGEAGPSFIDWQITIGEQSLECVICNNRGHADPVERRNVPGIGLENLRKRLDLLCPGKYLLEKSETPDVFRVQLIVPLHHEGEMSDRGR